MTTQKGSVPREVSMFFLMLSISKLIIHPTQSTNNQRYNIINQELFNTAECMSKRTKVVKLMMTFHKARVHY